MKRELAYGVTTAAVLLTLGAGAALVSCESVPSLYGPPAEDDPVSVDSDESDHREIDRSTVVLYGPPTEFDSDEIDDSTSSVSSGPVAK